MVCASSGASSLLGAVESAFRYNANRVGDSPADQPTNADLLRLYMRVLNLYATVMRAPSSSAASPLATVAPAASAASTPSEPSGQIFALTRLLPPTIGNEDAQLPHVHIFAESAALRAIEPALRGAYASFLGSVDAEAEMRCFALLEAALDGLAGVLEVANRKTLDEHVDELLVYAPLFLASRTLATTTLITQLLKCLFDRNPRHLETGALDALSTMNGVLPSG